MRSVSIRSAALASVLAFACEDASFEEKFESGKLKSKGTVQSHDDGTFSMTGTWTFWYESGQKKASGLFSDGRKFAKRGQLGVPKKAQKQRNVALVKKGNPKIRKERG